jgi:3-isopropylmalate/(R)-2-methylmalate dehydratase small subunit
MAEPFLSFASRVIPLPAENVDTDQIVPARYLKITDKAGLAEALFCDWRFEADGSLKNPRFVLDRPEMAGRRILLAGDNFGCGSSREHAPWALRAWGIQAVITTSSADIFRINSLKNGLLPIVIDPERHRQLFELIAREPDVELSVDLASQVVHLPGDEDLPFDVDPFSKLMLLEGTDELGYLLAKGPTIEAWEGAHPARVDTRGRAGTSA